MILNQRKQELNKVQRGPKNKNCIFLNLCGDKNQLEFTKNLSTTNNYLLLIGTSTLQHFSSINFFHEITSLEIYDCIVKESIRYSASTKNYINIFSVDELKAFLNIIFYSRYCKQPATRHCQIIFYCYFYNYFFSCTTLSTYSCYESYILFLTLFILILF